MTDYRVQAWRDGPQWQVYVPALDSSFRSPGPVDIVNTARSMIVASTGIPDDDITVRLTMIEQEIPE